MTQPITEEEVEFTASFDGYEPEKFFTLQDAMAFAQDIEKPTGAISYNGLSVVTYTAGDVELAMKP